MKTGQPYRDRHEAGEILGALVSARLGTLHEAVVLGLARGGVPVGFEVARALGARLDVFVIRKLGVPGHEEMAMGAIAGGELEVFNDAVLSEFGISALQLATVADRERNELRRREAIFREDRPPVSLQGRTVVLVDDGLATGFTMRAALAAVRERLPSRVVVAVPVGAVETCAQLSREVGTLICPFQPEPFHSVSLWYHQFAQTTDDEVREYLRAANVNYQTASNPPWSQR